MNQHPITLLHPGLPQHNPRRLARDPQRAGRVPRLQLRGPHRDLCRGHLDILRQTAPPHRDRQHVQRAGDLGAEHEVRVGRGQHGGPELRDGAGEVEADGRVAAEGQPVGERGHEVEVGRVQGCVGDFEQEVACFWRGGHGRVAGEGEGGGGWAILRDGPGFHGFGEGGW